MLLLHKPSSTHPLLCLLSFIHSLIVFLALFVNDDLENVAGSKGVAPSSLDLSFLSHFPPSSLLALLSPSTLSHQYVSFLHF